MRLKQLKCLLILGAAMPMSLMAHPKGLDLSLIDSTESPSKNFFKFADGTWLKNTKIPAEYSSWGSFDELQQNNYSVLKTILNNAAKENAPKGTLSQKVGDFYKAGMDSARIESLGVTPVAEQMKSIDQITDEKSIAREVANMHMATSSPMFSISVGNDAKESSINIVSISQGGISLPERDYYLKEDKDSKAIRAKYLEHVQKMLAFLGASPEQAARDAESIMAIETRLAKASLTRVEERDPYKIYHKMTLKELESMVPGFSWNEYFSAIGLKDLKSLNVAEPEFFKELGLMQKEVKPSSWRVYLKWKLLKSMAPYLSSKIVEENFNFNGKVLFGQQVMQPRWKRVLRAEDGSLGEAVGELYVKDSFPPSAKKNALDLVHNLIAAFKSRIENKVSWMKPETRTKALEKLAAITVKIGYPDKWIDYGKLDVDAGSYAQNIINASKFQTMRDLEKVGKAVDRTLWDMTPQTVNAYYNPQNNEIVFPAAILQFPFFDPDRDDAANYGAIGAVIGHEITHGFDDEGHQFDLAGNMKSWWTKEDEDNFKAAAKIIVEQFNKYTIADSVHLNGELTLGENLADFGGLNIAYTALKMTPQGKSNEKIDGFTPDQRFFLSWAQVWKSLDREEYAKMLAKVDPHSPAEYRVNGPLSNMPEFKAAFGIKEGEPMLRPASLRPSIW